MTNKIKKVKELFKKIQKIPYYCLKVKEPDKLMRARKGSCYEKNVFLGKQYEKLGISVKYMLMEFNWSQLPIPKEILNKWVKKRPEHLALKIKINEKWLWVDSTWDPKLEKAGFPVTKNWGGKSNTKLAVKGFNIKEWKKIPSKAIVPKRKEEFFNLLNKYLEKIRKK